MELNCSKGDRLVLVDKLCQKFEGVVKSVNNDLGILLLSKVVQHPGNKAIEGYRHFDKNEIVHLEVFDRKENDSGVDEVISPSVPESVYKKIEESQKSYRYINNFDSNFFSAVKLIKQCSKIGLYSVDVSKGRAERASLLAMSTSTQIFIFDIQVLGCDGFDKGVKEILESQNIIKVVHDCRLLSDCLKHKYLVSLENVRDVEAEDIMVVHQERRMIRKHSRSLDYLVKVYLNSEVNVMNVCWEDWSERPVSRELLEYVAQLVSYLLPLHEMIEKKYLERLINASHLYNNFVRDADLYESVHCNPKTTLRQQMINLVKRCDEPRTNYWKNSCNRKIG